MHHRITAWVLGSCTAPAALIITTVTAMVMKEGAGALLIALFWQALLGFLLLTLSLAVLSPLLLVPLERRALSAQWKIALMTVTLIAVVSFVVSLLIGALAVSILLGLLLNAIVMFFIVPRPNNTVERDEPQAARPSL